MSELTPFQRFQLSRFEKDSEKWIKLPAKVDETGVLVPDFGERKMPASYVCEETPDRKWFYVVVIG
jgi:hypothetical protein